MERKENDGEVYEEKGDGDGWNVLKKRGWRDKWKCGGEDGDYKSERLRRERKKRKKGKRRGEWDYEIEKWIEKREI